MNPMNLFQIKKLWNEFTARHPKFPNFIKAVSPNAIQEGTILEIQVTCPDELCFQPESNCRRSGNAPDAPAVTILI